MSRHEPGAYLQQRALAGPVLADDRHRLAGAHLQRYPVEHALAAERADDADRLEQRLSRPILGFKTLAVREPTALTWNRSGLSDCLPR